MKIHLSVPSLAALNAFEVFGREGGVRKAAQYLGVDHAIVSRHLRALEEFVGTTLVDRTNGDHRLTPEGQRYHARVTASLRDIADATELLRRRDRRDLVVWCSPGFAYHWLSRKLEDFSRQWPDFEMELRPADRGPDFSINEADADIRYVRAGDETRLPSGLRALVIASPPVFPVAHPNLAASLAERGFTNARDFLDQRLLHEDSDEEWRGWLKAQGVEAEGRLPGPRLWHAHHCLQAARDGQGIALANQLLLGDDLVKGALVPVHPSTGPVKPIPLGGYTILSREDRWRLTPFARFREWLRAAIAEENAKTPELTRRLEASFGAATRARAAHGAGHDVGQGKLERRA